MIITGNEIEKSLSLVKDYKEIEIPKKGGHRTLLIPPTELKKTQKKILHYLKRIWPYWESGIYGLYYGSYINHAELHSDSRFIFQFDIKDAFPSADTFRIKRLLYRNLTLLQKSPQFFEEGKMPIRFLVEEQRYISNQTMLNSWSEKSKKGGIKKTIEIKKKQRKIQDLKELSRLIVKLTSYKNTLPQGAPTSPFLFYILISAGGLFRSLQRCCSPKWMISCYVDGFVVSGNKPIPSDVQEKLLKTVEQFGFKVNKKKIRHQDCRKGGVMITGLVVDGTGKVRLPKRTIRKWRGIIHKTCFVPQNSELRKKIEGFIASLKPIYGKADLGFPEQIQQPYEKYKLKLVE